MYPCLEYNMKDFLDIQNITFLKVFIELHFKF